MYKLQCYKDNELVFVKYFIEFAFLSVYIKGALDKGETVMVECVDDESLPEAS